MMTDQTPLTISLMVLRALCKIEVDILESMDASDEMNMLIISLVHSNGYVQEKRCAFHLWAGFKYDSNDLWQEFERRNVDSQESK
jgi:hypothetical protein